jgi:hypothetical protein
LVYQRSRTCKEKNNDIEKWGKNSHSSEDAFIYLFNYGWDGGNIILLSKWKFAGGKKKQRK